MDCFLGGVETAGSGTARGMKAPCTVERSRMKPLSIAAAALFLIYLSASAFAQPRVGITGLVSMLKDSDYAPLEEDLIVVEVTPEGIPVEKRLAKEADLFFYRQLKTKLLFGIGGVKGYENELVLSLRNVSGRRLENVSVIETVPEEMAARAAKIESDENFLVLNEMPAIIQFFIEELVQGAEKKLSYKIGEGEKRVSEETLELMAPPQALIKLEKGSCIGIVCKDLDPCTRDYCEKGECGFEPMPDGAACGEGKQCISGECVEKTAAAPTTSVMPPIGLELIGLAFLATAIAFAAVVLLARGRKKEVKGGK